MQLWESIWLPVKLAMVHWPGHQKDHSLQTQGNNYTDQIATDEILGEPIPQTILELLVISKPLLYVEEDAPKHSSLETVMVSPGSGSCRMEGAACQSHWAGNSYFPTLLMHFSPKKISGLSPPHVWLPGHWVRLHNCLGCCLACAQTNTKKDMLPPGQ